jgi:hypothetical protein
MSQILQAMKDDDKGYKSLHWYLSALAKTETPTTNRLVIRSVFSNTKKEGEEERPYIFLNKSPEKGMTANPYCSRPLRGGIFTQFRQIHYWDILNIQGPDNLVDRQRRRRNTAGRGNLSSLHKVIIETFSTSDLKRPNSPHFPKPETSLKAHNFLSGTTRRHPSQPATKSKCTTR